MKRTKLMKSKTHKQTGITLIGLVVTIIILLILAGVVVATLTGDNGLLTKAGDAKNASEQANLEEEVQLALVENEADKYFTNSSIEDKLKAIFEKRYGTGNITVAKSGKNYKVTVKDTKTRYRVRYNGKVEKYEEMDPANVYARLDDDGTLYLRATQKQGYNLYNSSGSIESNWNTAQNARPSTVLKVIIEEPIAPIYLSNMFRNCTNLLEIQNIENLHTEKAINMSSMFNHCEKITKIDVSKFDTSKVTNMSQMFDCCYMLDGIDVSGFDTSLVTRMTLMFTECHSLREIDVSGFNTLTTEFLNRMFYCCNSLTKIDVSGFNTSNAKDLSYMFYGCSKIEKFDLSNFNTINVTDINHMFWRM